MIHCYVKRDSWNWKRKFERVALLFLWRHLLRRVFLALGDSSLNTCSQLICIPPSSASSAIIVLLETVSITQRTYALLHSLTSYTIQLEIFLGRGGGGSHRHTTRVNSFVIILSCLTSNDKYFLMQNTWSELDKFRFICCKYSVQFYSSKVIS